MPTLTITKTYKKYTVPTEGQLDLAFNSVSTFFNTTKLGSDNIQNSAVGSTQIADSSIITSKFPNNGVNSTTLSSSVSVDSDRAVGANHIKDSSITTAKFDPSGILVTNLPARPIGTSVGIGGFALSNNISSSWSLTYPVGVTIPETSIPNASITLVTTGRPVKFQCIPSGATQIPGIYTTYSGTGSSSAFLAARRSTIGAAIKLYRNGVLINQIAVLEIETPTANPGAAISGRLDPATISMIDTPAAGTHTYNLTIIYNNLPQATFVYSIVASDFKMGAYEL